MEYAYANLLTNKPETNKKKFTDHAVRTILVQTCEILLILTLNMHIQLTFSGKRLKLN